MNICKEREKQQIYGKDIEDVQNFTYLGSIGWKYNITSLIVCNLIIYAVIAIGGGGG